MTDETILAKAPRSREGTLAATNSSSAWVVSRLLTEPNPITLGGGVDLLITTQT